MVSEDLRFTSTVVGDVELKQRFADFGSNVRVLARRTLADIGEQLRDRISAGAPRKSGDLSESVRATLTETDAKMTESVRPTLFYARFIEYGVVNHGTLGNKRSVSKADLRKKGKRGLVARVRELRSQGAYRIAPHPFIGPAWAGMQAQAQAQIAAALAEAVKED